MIMRFRNAACANQLTNGIVDSLVASKYFQTDLLYSSVSNESTLCNSFLSWFWTWLHKLNVKTTWIIRKDVKLSADLLLLQATLVNKVNYVSLTWTSNNSSDHPLVSDIFSYINCIGLQHNLKAVHFCGCRAINTSLFQGIKANITAYLKVLHLEDCIYDEVNVKVIDKITEVCTMLTDFKLTYKNPELILFSSYICIPLSKRSVPISHHPTESGINNLINGCRALRLLHLEYYGPACDDILINIYRLNNRGAAINLRVIVLRIAWDQYEPLFAIQIIEKCGDMLENMVVYSTTLASNIDLASKFEYVRRNGIKSVEIYHKHVNENIGNDQKERSVWGFTQLYELFKKTGGYTAIEFDGIVVNDNPSDSWSPILELIAENNSSTLCKLDLLQDVYYAPCIDLILLNSCACVYEKCAKTRLVNGGAITLGFGPNVDVYEDMIYVEVIERKVEELVATENTTGDNA